MNVIEPVWGHAARDPGRIALVFGHATVSYGALMDSATLVAGRLLRLGIRRGDRIAVTSRHPLVYLTTILAASHIGAATMAREPETLDREGSAGGTPAPFAMEIALESEFEKASLTHDTFRITAERLFAKPDAGADSRRPDMAMGLEAERWMTLHSSGTTGQPKRIPISHGLAAARAAVRYGLKDDTRIMLLVGLGTGAGVMPALSALRAGGSVVMPAESHMRDVVETARSLAPEHIFMSTGHAGSLTAWIARYGAEASWLGGGVECVHVAGSPVSPALIARLQRTFRSQICVHYGATETGPLALAHLSLGSSDDMPAFRLHPWVEAEAVDPSGKAQAAGNIGFLRFRTPLSVESYEEGGAISEAVFVDGWIQLGDRGCIHADGRVVLSGRGDDLINLGGTKIDPSTVESAIDSMPGVRESCAMAVTLPNGSTTHALAITCDGMFDVTAIKAHLAERLPSREMPTLIVRVDGIVRNETGKVLRRQCALMVESMLAEAMLRMTPASSAESRAAVDPRNSGK